MKTLKYHQQYQIVVKKRGYMYKNHKISKNEKRYLAVLGTAVGVTALSGVALAQPGAYSADHASSSTASITVVAACTMTGVGGDSHVASILNGEYRQNIGTTTLTTVCNDANGYAIYAVGFGNNTVGNNKLHSDEMGSTFDIATGTGTSGSSQWSMKVTQGSVNPPSIVNNFSLPHEVPDSYAKVAEITSPTGSTGSTVNTTYNTYISQSQPPGTYTGQVKYVLVHPSGGAVDDNLIMQSVDVWKETMLTGESYKVTDARDSKQYWVTKLEDGKIWMTQNLDLCIGCSGTDALDSSNTDINVSGTGAYATGYSTGVDGVVTWTPSGSTVSGSPATVNFANKTVSGWVNENYLPYMAEGSNNILYSQDTTVTANMTACTEAGHTQAECERFQIGNYYNWTAAIASNNSESISSQYTVAQNSICPKGWRLPDGLTRIGGTVAGSEFNTMLKVAGITDDIDTTGGQNTGYASGGWNKITNTKYAFSRFGHLADAVLYSFGTNGNWWSSTASSSAIGYNLGMPDFGVWPASTNYRLYGFMVRCVANTTIDDISTMQEFSTMGEGEKMRVIASMDLNKQYQLTDTRDGKTYWVAKLADGNVWMTENLDIAGGTTLACDKTDCDSSYTLPSDQGWQFTGKLPDSSTTGFDNDNYAYVYNSESTTCGDQQPCYSYYSWDAATLGSGRSIGAQNTDAPYSICPKGWRLPTSGQHNGATAVANWKRGDFYRLATAYGADLESSYSQHTDAFYKNAGAGTVANFILSGTYSDGALYNGGEIGGYWSSTSTNSTTSRFLEFRTGYVSSADNGGRHGGLAIRCMVR